MSDNSHAASVVAQLREAEQDDSLPREKREEIRRKRRLRELEERVEELEAQQDAILELVEEEED